MIFSKWILFCFLITALVLTTQSQPTPTTTADIVKRQSEEQELSSVADLHHATLTRTATRTATRTNTDTATATSTNKGGSGSNNKPDPEPRVIPAKTTEWYVAVYGTASGISPQMASLGAILIVIGLFLCTMGYRMFKILIGVMGLLTFGSMAWIALANCRPTSGYSMDSITMIVVPAGVGIVGAAVYYYFWTLAIYMTCAYGGFIFALFILSWRSDFVIVSLIGRSCFLGGMALACAVASFFLDRAVMIFAATFVGAYIFMFGVDCLSRTGFIAGPQAMLNRNPNHLVEYQLSTNIYVMLAMIILMYLIFYVWQWIFFTLHHLQAHLVGAATGKPVHREAKEEGHLAEDHQGPPSSPPPS